jgi:molybdopterin-guanine dinucleotide biosynthesis protein A
MNSRVGGLVLAGGRSSRFGTEKAVARLGGWTLLAWSLDALGRDCLAVAVNAPRGAKAEVMAKSLGHAVLPDHPAYARGPLAGVAAGLAWARGKGFDRLVTLPCDTPFVGPAEIAALLAAIGEAAAAHAVTPDGPQPLCAVWRVDLEEPLSACLIGGNHPSVRSFMAEVGAVPVTFDDARVFRNANTRGALARMEEDVDAVSRARAWAGAEPA